MKVHGTYIKKILETWNVGTKGIFTAYVDYGIENFNLKKVYHAHVKAKFSGCSGHIYDNFDEAKTEALNLLEEEYNLLEEDIKRYRDNL